MESTLDKYVEQVNFSSDRARKSLYLVVVVSAVLASALWNYRPGSWDQREREVKEFVRDHASADPVEFSKPAFLSGLESKGVANNLPVKAQEYVASVLKTEWSPALEKLMTDQLEDDAKNSFESFGRVKFPALGLVFNTRDTALIGGFALCIALVVLRFALAREAVNLAMTFRKAKAESSLKDAYDLLSMSQVFSVPKDLASVERSGCCWNKVHKLLFALPVLVQAMIVLVDMSMIANQWSVCRFNTLTVASSGILFLIVSIVLTLSCLFHSAQADRLWEQFRTEIIVPGGVSSESNNLELP